MMVKGDSDVFITRRSFPLGAHTGWHTHPSPSLVTVTAGTITAYEAADPTCTPHVYNTGDSFTDLGCGDVHNVVNNGTETAIDVAVQIVPAAAQKTRG
jgi:quercetin dioxygenase-like cupin family protein